MNILVVNWQDRENPHAGGAEVHLFELFGRLARRGHRVRLVCSGWPGASARVELDGIEVTRVGDRHSFALLGRGAVRRALRAEPVDLVVEDINKIPLFLAGLTDAPSYVIVPHLFGTTAFQEAPFPMAALVWLLERPIPRVYRRAAFHAISESTRDDLVARGVSPKQIRVIHPGVDAQALRPDPAQPRQARPTFVYVGRLKRYKGVEIAIRALALARRTRPDLFLEIAGTGDDRPRLEALVRRLGVGDAVRFHGFVPEAEKLRLLRTAWANLFPSPKEGWGITNVEAAACGTPSLASDSPGLRDSVRAGETGFLVPHGDVAALAGRMLELAADPALVERLGRGARRFAETLSWDRAAELTERHLHETLAGPTR
ncbi:MAG TPA: glycosyltransferase family 4 protein [Gemmatimonadales bacterium]|nr:glycosyltransferase family 4 protein [Gemmatimonadales bacterium]